MSVRLVAEIEHLTRFKIITCSCGYSWEIPTLWFSDSCERCGLIALAPPNSAEQVIHASLNWAGLNPEALDCLLGDPRLLPPQMVSQLEKRSGLVFFSLDDTFQFECKRCGQCCAKNNLFDLESESATLTEMDITILGIDSGIDVSIPRKLIKNPETGSCSFWQSEKGCYKYSYRPLFCRIFPLGTMWLERSGFRTQYLCLMGPDCPGLYQGPKLTVRDFLRQQGCLHRFFRPLNV